MLSSGYTHAYARANIARKKEMPLTSPENGNHDQDDETGNETQSVECGRERQYSQTDLRLHHQDGSSHPSDL
jgi:hypothetical protein